MEIGNQCPSDILFLLIQEVKIWNWEIVKGIFAISRNLCKKRLLKPSTGKIKSSFEKHQHSRQSNRVTEISHERH